MQQQQQQQVQSQPTAPMIPGAHAQAAAALYQQYYPSPFGNIPQFINATPQQMALGVLGAPMIPVQPLIGTGPSTSSSNNGGSSGMTTPNSSVSGGPTYKVNNNNNNNNNQAHSGDNSNTVANSVPPKKAVVSVQRPEQSNVPQQQQQAPAQQIIGAGQMVYPAGPNRYYAPEYLAQRKYLEFHYLIYSSLSLLLRRGFWIDVIATNSSFLSSNESIKPHSDSSSCRSTTEYNDFIGESCYRTDYFRFSPISLQCCLFR